MYFTASNSKEQDIVLYYIVKWIVQVAGGNVGYLFDSEGTLHTD